DSGAVDMYATMDNLENGLSNPEKSDTSFDETPSSDDRSSGGPSSDETYYDDSTKKPKTTARKGPTKDSLKWYDNTTDEDIAKFEVASKSKGSSSKPKKGSKIISICRIGGIRYGVLGLLDMGSTIIWNIHKSPLNTAYGLF
ncbi:hypothetical protein Tco_0801578, partial [Tanacetum coccineum]